MSELKNCPFCGTPMNISAKKELIGWHKFNCFFNFLEEAEVDMDDDEIFEAFVKSWNYRSGVWVPVSEKIPPDGERVLVFHDDYVVRIGMAVNGKFASVLNKGLKRCNVTHWKPLPVGPISCKISDFKPNGND